MILAAGWRNFHSCALHLQIGEYWGRIGKKVPSLKEPYLRPKGFLTDGILIDS